MIVDELEAYAKKVMPNYPNDICSRAKAEIVRLRAIARDARDHVPADVLARIDAALGGEEVRSGK